MRFNKKLVKHMLDEGGTEDSAGNYHSKEYVDGVRVAAGFGACLLIIFMFVILGLCCVPLASHMLRKPGPPPTVVTKIVKEDGLSEAQHAYISNCQSDTESGSGGSNPGIPDVHTEKWSCSYAH
jgi:hypothetical protein